MVRLTSDENRDEAERSAESPTQDPLTPGKDSHPRVPRSRNETALASQDAAFVVTRAGFEPAT